jgi:isochorismate pyruvate lyase
MDDMRLPARRFTAPDPADCQNMSDVRAGVDEIDRRQGYMDAAARIKTDRATVLDEARIKDVLAKVRAEAESQGLEWSIAEPVWRKLMERCIAYEFDVWDALRAQRKRSQA